jgi:hypothetical protein
MSQRPLASVATAPTSNGTGYNPMQRPILFQDPGGETHAANNLTTSTGGGPPVVQDFLTSTANGRVNAFYQPQSGGAYNPNQQPVAMPAPDNFQDQSDTPVTYVGDKWPRMNKQTSGNNWAVTVQDYLTGSNAPLSNTHTANATFEAKNDTGGYGAAFKGYSMGPAYYGKTFWMWPPDPRFGGGTQAPDPTKISPTDPKKDIYGNYLCDWRKRFFTYPGASTPMDDNSRLFDASGFFQQPSGTTYAVNYKAILAWLKSGPQVLPPNLHAGRVSYYTSIPSDIPTSGGTLDQVFWKNYIDTALGINSTYRGQRSLFGRETAGWGTVKITAKSSLLNGGNPNGPPNTVPYMQYNDNPIRPRAHFWFGPMTMLMFLSTDSEGSPNMWPGTCHESHCWQLKAGINSAIDDVRNNHPNDWACEIFFSSIDSYATPRVTMGRNYTRMKNALFFPFTLLDSLGDDTAEYVPYNSSFSYLGSGTVPNADGGTCPEMAFKVAYSQFSGGNGGAGRRGAAKVVVFETDGVPNTTGPGNFVNGGPYRSYYTGISAGSYLGNNNATVTSQAITAVQQICALDTAASPGYSTTRMPARVHAIAFGDLFETNQTQEQNALAFLLNVQKSGNTSAPGDSSIEPYKIITGDYNTRIDRIRQALERIMQSGVQVSLIK